MEDGRMDKSIRLTPTRWHYTCTSPTRIPPLTDAQLSPEQREALAPASYPDTPPLNISRPPKL
jgi:hypothetical protein